MGLVAYIEADAEGQGLARSLAWALRIAARRGPALALLLPGEAPDEAGKTEHIEWLDLHGPREDPARGEGPELEVCAGLDRELGPESWRAATEDAAEAGKEDGSPDPLEVRVGRLHARDPIPLLLGLQRESKADSILFVQPRLEAFESGSGSAGRRLLDSATCELVFLRPGTEEGPSSGIAVATSGGPQCRAALRLGDELAEAGRGPATAFFVEPLIGPDALGVGEHVLEGTLARMLGRDADHWRTHVVLDDEPHHGIARFCRERDVGLIVLGTSHVDALGRRLRGTLVHRVLRATEEQTVAVVRAPVRIQNRARRLLEGLLQQVVPQLERDHRIALVERVQSSSRWDFDFMALMCLATGIAAVGLMENASAVIIGGMLVAPLMTPLLGLGLALVQGNPRLVRITLPAIGLGFMTAFAIGAALGFLRPDLDPTPEMLGRDWPNVMDLFVAFVAGLAGAYTSSRPGLLAALPGVAIAAALVPPIATAGIAAALGDRDLAFGAALLFLANMVAIVLATTFALWVVGLRYDKEGSNWTRFTGAALVATGIALALYLSLVKPSYEPPDSLPRELRAVIEARLDDDGFRLRELVLDDGREPPELLVKIGGAGVPTADLAWTLRAEALEHLPAGTSLRLMAAWESVASAADDPRLPKGHELRPRRR